LNVLKSAWSKLDPQVQFVSNLICADFARDAQGKAPSGPYRVPTNDLNILKTYWSKLVVPNSGLPLCEASKAVVPASGLLP